MLNGRIYRAAFLPLVGAVVVAGFSLTGRTAPLTSNLTPQAFEGARAFASLQGLAKRFPDRGPGSADDQALAAYVVRTLRGLGSPAAGGFAVTAHSFRAQTVAGERTLTTVVAQRPGTTGEAPLVVLAHRDAAGRGAEAELSGTAVLLELARVLAAGETRRTIVLVSTSGGSGGNAGAADFATHAGEALGGASGSSADAALVLGDLAGTGLRTPLVGAFSDGPGSAPALLQSTVAAALAAQAGVEAGTPSTLAQLAHLVFPLPAGEQAPLDARGLPAVLLGAGGERPAPASEPVSAARLEGFGRAALAAVYALDGEAEVHEWARSGAVDPAQGDPRVGAAPPGGRAVGAGAARARGRPRPPAPPQRTCGAVGGVGGGVRAPVSRRRSLRDRPGAPARHPSAPPAGLPAATALDRAALEAVLATALVLVLAWLGWPATMRRLGLPCRPSDEDAAVLAPLLVLGALAVVVWVLAPLTALLLVLPLHVWLVFASPLRPPRGRVPLGALGLVALGAAPLALLVAFYAAQLELGLGGVAHTAVLLLAGGRVGVAGAAAWSVAFGCLAAVLLVALAPPPAERPWIGGPEDGLGEREAITVRGPLSYAGPGSLGGTESALRR